MLRIGKYETCDLPELEQARRTALNDALFRVVCRDVLVP